MNEEALDRRFLLTALGGVAGVAALSSVARGGPITPPPGPVGPTGHTTDELWGKIARTDAGLAEPRTPVQSLPGSATAQYVISQPGSYYLTGNIEGVADKNCIEINADNVSLDLGGFSLIGTIASRSAVLIDRSAPHQHIHICNGSIRRWGGYGILGDTAQNSSARYISFQQVGQNGAFDRGVIQLGADSVIADCMAQDSAGLINLGDRGLITRCISNGNGVGGFGMIRDGVITDCEAISPNGNGFMIQEGGLIMRCTARYCNGRGFQLFRGATLLDCSALNCVIGVQASSSNCLVQRVNVSLSSQVGIDVSDAGGGTVVDECVVTDSNIGFRVQGTSGHFIRRCAARGNTGGNYSIAAGNAFGPIVVVAGVGAINTVTNANHPWANFSF